MNETPGYDGAVAWDERIATGGAGAIVTRMGRDAAPSAARWRETSLLHRGVAAP